MSRGFRLVCLDLDGTLLNPSSEISRRSAQVLRRCAQSGTAVYLVTGRPYCFTKYLALQAGIELGVICSNGACYEIAGDVITHEMEQKDIRGLVQCMRSFPVHGFFKGQRQFYTHESYDPRFLYDHMNSCFPAQLKVKSYTDLSYEDLARAAKGILKVLVYSENRELLARFRAMASSNESVSVSSYNEISLEIVRAGVSKGTAVRLIQNDLGITKEDTLAIGDGENDLSMFAQAGFKVAMGNANQMIKDLADAVTADNGHDGVAQALEQFVI